jgi:hypothetical protein
LSRKSCHRTAPALSRRSRVFFLWSRRTSEPCIRVPGTNFRSAWRPVTERSFAGCSHPILTSPSSRRGSLPRASEPQTASVAPRMWTSMMCRMQHVARRDTPQARRRACTTSFTSPDPLSCVPRVLMCVCGVTVCVSVWVCLTSALVRENGYPLPFLSTLVPLVCWCVQDTPRTARTASLPHTPRQQAGSPKPSTIEDKIRLLQSWTAQMQVHMGRGWLGKGRE